ncbi:MAG TPA: DUF4136 domain-containing protein [Cyclobacteriaceae bacterium]|nr:DUF4136 domain-containing protein [Cyclobacteriaceae bacterium]
MRALTLILLLMAMVSQAQEMKVTFDKNRDMTGYKTFRLGESEVTTPVEMRNFDEKVLREKVYEIIAKELTEKGLHQSDSNAQLVISFIIGYVERADMYNAGPFGGTPGSVTSGPSVQDSKIGTLVIDLDDRSDNPIWRISANVRYVANDILGQIESAVEQGFRKFPHKVKTKKK